ncbi:MAG: hypothetical protein Q9227_008754 [Pyrenula ochraceoflavens]
MKPYFGLRGGWLTFWGGVIVTDDFLDTLGIRGDTSLISTITAIYDVGCFFGAIATMWLGEKLGRRKTVLVGTTIMTIGAILQISAYSVAQMIVARIIAGVGNGINTATAPVWQTETSQVKWRGKLVIIELILNIAGFSLSNWMTYGFSFVGGPVAWRFPLAFQLVFIAILFATTPWLPESPRWLIAHEYEDEAFQIIADLENKSIDDPFVITQHKEIVFAVTYEKENTVPWSDLIRGKTGGKGGTGTIRRLILGMGAQAIQQLAGINVTSYYLPTVLISSVHLSNTMARLLAACNSVSYLLFSLIAIPNVEKWGRRKLLLFGASGQAFCYLIITVLLRFSEKPGYAHAHEVASASIAFFFLYYVFFGIGLQGVPWLYPTEINSLSMRTKGAALGYSTIVEITPIGIDSLKWKFYIIWTVFNAAFVPIIYFFFPETTNRTLEDIDRLFRDGVPLFVVLDKDAVSSKRPAKYIEHEQSEVRRNSSVDPVALRRGSRLRKDQLSAAMEREQEDEKYGPEEKEIV